MRFAVSEHLIQENIRLKGLGLFTSDDETATWQNLINLNSPSFNLEVSLGLTILMIVLSHFSVETDEVYLDRRQN